MFMNDLYAAQLLTRSPQHLSNQRKRVSSVHNSSPAQNYKKNRAGMVPYSFIAGYYHRYLAQGRADCQINLPCSSVDAILSSSTRKQQEYKK